jgi:hypothetical protein
MTLEAVNVPGSAKLPFHQHAMLLYSNDEAPTKYVNEVLSRGHLTVYVPINTDNDASHISNISKMTSGIVNYEDNVNHGNLLTLDTRSFYNFALAGNIQPFEELKILLEEAIRERIASNKNDEVTFVSGIGGTLAINQKFDECINVEKWWQKTHSEWLQNGLKVTMTCLHPGAIFDNSQQFMHYKQAMSSLHDDVMLDARSA